MTSHCGLRSAGAVLGLFVLIGCSSGAPAATPARTSAAASLPAQATVNAGATTTASALCVAFSPQLAVAALGGPVDAPQSGDVLPRPSGVYCHYALTGDSNTNAEAQLNDMTREEFEALDETINATTPLPGVGEVAFSRSTSIMGGPGAVVAAWSNGRGVTVTVARAGDASVTLPAATAIAAAVLASS